MEDLLMGDQAAQYLGVSRQRLHQLTREGLGRRMSGHWIFTRKELDEYRVSEKNKGGRPKEELTGSTINKGPEYVAA